MQLSSALINVLEVLSIRNTLFVIVQIGSGAYGIVVSAEDTTTGKRVAIKKVGNAFQ